MNRYLNRLVTPPTSGDPEKDRITRWTYTFVLVILSLVLIVIASLPLSELEASTQLRLLLADTVYFLTNVIALILIGAVTFVLAQQLR